jgi:hypothetical protein
MPFFAPAGAPCSNARAAAAIERRRWWRRRLSQHKAELAEVGSGRERVPEIAERRVVVVSAVELVRHGAVALAGAGVGAVDRDVLVNVVQLAGRQERRLLRDAEARRVGRVPAPVRQRVERVRRCVVGAVQRLQAGQVGGEAELAIADGQRIEQRAVRQRAGSHSVRVGEDDVVPAHDTLAIDGAAPTGDSGGGGGDGGDCSEQHCCDRRAAAPDTGR